MKSDVKYFVKPPPIRPTLHWNEVRQEYELWDWDWRQASTMRDLRWHFDWTRKVWVTSVEERARPFWQYADRETRLRNQPALPKPLH